VHYDAPTANFTFDTGVGRTHAPKSVSFLNNSTGATSYSWNFGDGTSSTDIAPTHSYTTGGTFNVTLTATGQGGSATKTLSVFIDNPVTSLKISQIELSNIPFINPGTGLNWDSGNGPDIYIVIVDPSGNAIFTTNTVSDINQAMLGTYVRYSLPDITLNVLNAIYTVKIIEAGAPADREMYRFTFNPSTFDPNITFSVRQIDTAHSIDCELSVEFQ
jgi:PKD repeat protein